MHTLIGRLGAMLGVDRAAADKAADIILPFRRLRDAAKKLQPASSGSLARTQQSIDHAPIRASNAIRKNTVGLGMRLVSARVCETTSYARQSCGTNAVGDFDGAVPGRLA
jgi:hypothetical protein